MTKKEVIILSVGATVMLAGASATAFKFIHEERARRTIHGIGPSNKIVLSQEKIDIITSIIDYKIREEKHAKINEAYKIMFVCLKYGKDNYDPSDDVISKFEERDIKVRKYSEASMIERDGFTLKVEDKSSKQRGYILYISLQAEAETRTTIMIECSDFLNSLSGRGYTLKLEKDEQGWQVIECFDEWVS